MGIKLIVAAAASEKAAAACHHSPGRASSTLVKSLIPPMLPYVVLGLAFKVPAIIDEIDAYRPHLEPLFGPFVPHLGLRKMINRFNGKEIG